MNKTNFEKLIKKDISTETYSLYKKLYATYKEYYKDESTIEGFVKLINIKEIPQDKALKEKRQKAKKIIPEIEIKLRDLDNKLKTLEQTIMWVQASGSKNINHYVNEKIKLKREINLLNKELSKIKNSIK